MTKLPGEWQPADFTNLSDPQYENRHCEELQE